MDGFVAKNQENKAYETCKVNWKIGRISYFLVLVFTPISLLVAVNLNRKLRVCMRQFRCRRYVCKFVCLLITLTELGRDKDVN